MSARSLIETLRGLSHKEKVTVVATLHQPSSSIFRLFDDLLVLHSGTVLYHGPASEMVDFYAKCVGGVSMFCDFSRHLSRLS